MAGTDGARHATFGEAAYGDVVELREDRELSEERVGVHDQPASKHRASGVASCRWYRHGGA
jgi:hypothetical protein